jgi:hypothetical protein
MIIQDLRIADLGAVFQFHERAEFASPVRVVLDDARLIVASTGESFIYLKGTTHDSTGAEFPVVCFFNDDSERDLRLRRTTFPPRFHVEIVGRLFDWVRGVGVTVNQCQIHDFAA